MSQTPHLHDGDDDGVRDHARDGRGSHIPHHGHDDGDARARGHGRDDRDNSNLRHGHDDGDAHVRGHGRDSSIPHHAHDGGDAHVRDHDDERARIPDRFPLLSSYQVKNSCVRLLP